MSEDTDKNKIDDTINSVTKLVNAVPIYEDALQPLAKEMGKAFSTIGKTVNVAIAPLKGIIWGYEKFESFIANNLTSKLKNTSHENIITPPSYIAVPAFEALRYAGNNDILRELYANLLASSMDKETSSSAHPSFVEILK